MLLLFFFLLTYIYIYIYPWQCREQPEAPLYKGGILRRGGGGVANWNLPSAAASDISISTTGFYALAFPLPILTSATKYSFSSWVLFSLNCIFLFLYLCEKRWIAIGKLWSDTFIFTTLGPRYQSGLLSLMIFSLFNVHTNYFFHKQYS